jgi:hypothetical protein
MVNEMKFMGEPARMGICLVAVAAGFAWFLLGNQSAPRMTPEPMPQPKADMSAPVQSPAMAAETHEESRPAATASAPREVAVTTDSPQARAIALEESLRTRKLELAESPDLIFELAQLIQPSQRHDQAWLQFNGYPAGLEVHRWSEAEIRANLRRPGALEALELLKIDRGELPRTPRPVRLPNGLVVETPSRLDGQVLGRTFGGMVAAGYFLGLIGPGFSEGQPQTVRDHKEGLMHHFATQRLGDRSLLPAVIAAYPDYRFPLRDYVFAVGRSTGYVQITNRSRARRGLPVKDGWRELD